MNLKYYKPLGTRKLQKIYMINVNHLIRADSKGNHFKRRERMQNKLMSG